jgi:oxalate decarboxylase
MKTTDSPDAVATVRGDEGASVLGPDNVAVALQNPGAPPTDSGSLPNLKFPFAAAHNRLQTGGWAREVTVRELPVATTLAGVNMRLKAGAYRELHWHKEAEWAFMLSGSARIAAIDPQGRNFVDDIGRGDLWNFRAGFPHSIQALEDCEFLLVFDDGNFSENETFLVTDWFAHTPKHVLAKNFGVPEAAFANIPAAGDIEHTRYIFPGEVPGTLVADIEATKSPAGTAERMSHRMLAQDPIEVPGGSVRITDSTNFPAASTIAAAFVELRPGAVRELHWHPNNDELAVLAVGTCADDRVRLQRKGQNIRLLPRRRRLRPTLHGPLHRKRRRGASADARAVPQRPLRRRVTEPVAGPHPGRGRRSHA